MTLNVVIALFCVISANLGSFRAHCVKVHVRYLISWWLLVCEATVLEAINELPCSLLSIVRLHTDVDDGMALNGRTSMQSMQLMSKLLCSCNMKICSCKSQIVQEFVNKNSSGNEIANVNFYDDIVHADASAYTHSRASTPHKRWSKCTMEN